MRIAVLAKQIPSPAAMSLSAGRMVRDGVRLETNSYCRRANSRAVALAGDEGEVVVFSMGPPSAEQTLREMLACGATRGVLISDKSMAGSDTLITARVLARALASEGPFDLVLAGAYSLDSETGHVGIQVAEFLGLPLLGPCRELDIVDGVAVATTECEGGFVDVEALLPVVASTAERLCAPSKASAEQCAAVPSDRITVRCAADLALNDEEVGAAASPTRVGEVRYGKRDVMRGRMIAASPDEALRLLEVRAPASDRTAAQAPEPWSGRSDSRGDELWCVLDPTAYQLDRELLLGSAALASATARRAVAIVGGAHKDLDAPVDRVLAMTGPQAPEDWVAPLCGRLTKVPPHCVIAEASNWGRELCARVAARLGWGLVGDAVRLSPADGKVVAWKSAFAGQAMVAVTSTSPALLATVRPGVLSGAPGAGQPGRRPVVETIETTSISRVVTDPVRDLDPLGRDLASARVVVVVGGGVGPDEYGALRELIELLDAGPLAASRRVTDRGWLPRTRQIGITGRSVAPDLVVSIGASGSFNHAAGFAQAGRVLAVNSDPGAEIFEHADVGVVGDWHEVVPGLCAALRRGPRRLASMTAVP